jgi:hypothetical protein
MVDCRAPVRIDLGPIGLGPIDASVEWCGSKGPVKTGDNTKFCLVVHNANTKKDVKGSMEILGVLFSPFPGLGARPRRTIGFSVGAGKTERYKMEEEWMWIEGKFSCILTGYTLAGSAQTGVEHPLASLTVFERSTYDSQSRTSTATLLTAIVAAIGSILAASFAGALLLR